MLKGQASGKQFILDFFGHDKVITLSVLCEQHTDNAAGTKQLVQKHLIVTCWTIFLLKSVCHFMCDIG